MVSHADISFKFQIKLLSASVNLQFELLYEMFHAVLEDHVPLLNPSQTQQQISEKQWMAADIYNMIQKKYSVS